MERQRERRMTWLVIERTGVKLYKPYYRTAKRTLDLVLCLLVAPFFIPLALIIAVLIHLESPGPIFFVQERIGKGSKLFKIIKFRTMYHNIGRESHRAFMKAYVNGKIDAANNKVFKPFNEKQVTPIGRILRKTSLDELPQLINVLKGEMSLVGPRPNVLWEVEEYQGWHQERLEVLPGITGLAQVRGRSGISFDEIVKYDIEYLEKRNLWLDLKIMWWTIVSVVAGRGAH
jgi:lipopolysaccharide/colanic/teichoic acid biosynthesis glycosyltransferase